MVSAVESGFIFGSSAVVRARNPETSTTMKIDEYFDGKQVLVTGATGLLGKALVEKLLRCCPKIAKIYVIIRPRRGCEPNERWAATTQSYLFNYLRDNDPQSFSKVVVLPGDGAKDNFGLSEKDQKMLIENVNLVYHGAASINFFNSIVTSLETNLKSTHSLLELARKMKKLECFTHISTAYCNFDKKGDIEEVVYDQQYDWREMLELIKDEQGADALRMLEPRLLEGHLTTYTLTKAMAEVAVREYTQYFPTVIIRPVLVTATHKDPLPGWLDVDNFITLYCKGVRMGVLRLIPNSIDTVIEMVPLDLCVRGIIISTWKRNEFPSKDVEVYCHRMEDEFRLRYRDLQLSMKISEGVIMPNTLWYNFFFFVANPMMYGILFLFLHVISGFSLDLALKLSGQKPRLKKVYTDIWRYNSLARYYEKPHHRFLSGNFNKLESYIREDDKKEFSLDYSNFDKEKYIVNMSLSVMKYSWNESIDDENVMLKSRKRYKMLTVLHYALCAVGLFIFFKTLWPLLRSTVDDRIRLEDPTAVPVSSSFI